jgi:hypothetical protein
MNYKLITKEIPVDTFILTGKINNKEIINNLINFVKNNKDEELSYKGVVKGHFTGFKSLINNKYFINFLKTIQGNIKIICKNNILITDAWGNLCKINEEVIGHNHENVSGFCGILYLTDNGPGTYFRDYDLLIDEEIGKYVLFHPILWHEVKKITNNIERITIAFNIDQVKFWSDLTNVEWVNKNEV